MYTSVKVAGGDRSEVKRVGKNNEIPSPDPLTHMLPPL